MPKNYRKKASSRSYQSGSGSNKFGWIVFGVLIGLFFALMVYWKLTSKTTYHETSEKVSESHPTEKNSKKTTIQPTTPANTNTPEFDFYTVLPNMQVASTHTSKTSSSTTALDSTSTTTLQKTTEPVSTSAAANTQTETQANAIAATPPASVATTQTPNSTTTPPVETKLTTTTATAPETIPPPLSANTNTTTTSSTEESVSTQEKEPTVKNPTVKKPDIKLTETKNTNTTEHYMLQMASLKNYADADRLKAQLTMLGFDIYIQSYSKNGQIYNRVVMGPYSKAIALQQQTLLQKNHIASILVRVP